MESSGFLIVDAQFRPIYANRESVRILGYPNLCSETQSLDGILTQKVTSFLPGDLGTGRNTCAIQFKSGRRLYHCRAFLVGDHWRGGESGMRFALLMERGLPDKAHGERRRKLPAGMHEDPFSFTPDPRFYQHVRAQSDVLASLRGLVLERRGVAVLLGQAGMGKTALIGYLMENLKDRVDCASISGSFDSQSELVRSVMAVLGLKRISRNLGENLRLFEEWLLEQNRAGQHVVVVCDNAQDVDAVTIQSLCKLANLGGWRRKLLQVVLVGRQELAVRLRDPRLADVAGKINIFCRLNVMDQAEVQSYVLHRLRIAGCDRTLFSAAALAAIATYSRGVPLNVNMICRHCLSVAVSNSIPVVDERTVADSAYDLVLRKYPASLSGEETGDPDGGAGMGRRRDRRGLKLIKGSQ